jgi:gas vesicle structural protein
MSVERVSGNSSLIDVLDRILDKGIVLDPWVRISLMGIDLMAIEDHVVVASIETCLKYAEAPASGGLAAKPAQSEGAPQPGIDTVPHPARRRR